MNALTSIRKPSRSSSASSVPEKNIIIPAKKNPINKLVQNKKPKRIGSLLQTEHNEFIETMKHINDPKVEIEKQKTLQMKLKLKIMKEKII